MNYFYSRFDENRCSTRLRCLLPFGHLDITDKLPSTYRKGDFIFFKTPNNRELKKAKEQGAITVYDICDLWTNFMNRNNIELMLKECHLITTSTKGMKSFIKEKFNKPVVVIPSSLDWDYTKKLKYRKRNRIAVWTSYGHAFYNLEMIYQPLIESGFTIKVISSLDFLGRFKYKKNIQFVEWNLKTVDSEMAKADFMIIPLRNRKFNFVKEEHRMLKAWAIGLPCYATPIDSYIDLCDKEGISKSCLVEDWSNLEPIEWHPKLRKIALKYSSKNIAERWKLIIELSKVWYKGG